MENEDLAAIEVEEQFPDPLENTNPIEVDQPAEKDDNSSSFKRPKVSSSLTKQYLCLNPQGKYFVKMLLIFYRNIVELTNHFNGDITTA